MVFPSVVVRAVGEIGADYCVEEEQQEDEVQEAYEEGGEDQFEDDSGW